MTLPYISVAKKNGSAVPVGAANSKCAVIGPSSAGIKETELYTFANPGDVTTDIGYGNAQEAAQLMIAMAPTGFASVDVIVASASIAGTVTQISAASPTITVTGTPYASYDIRAEIVSAGVTGSARFKYSLDGGNTYTDNLQVPLAATYAIPNTGLTFSFGAGSNAVGNATHYDVQGPMMNSTDLTNAIARLSSSNTNYTTILIADDSPAPQSCSALFTTMDGLLTTLNNTQYKPTMAVMNVGGETFKFNRSFALTPGTYRPVNVLANITGSAASEGNFIAAVAERANTYLAVPQPGYARPRKPFAWAVAGEVHGVGSDISLNISQAPVRRVETPSYDEFKNGSVYHDERIIAPRTYQGEAGISVNQGLLKYNPATAASFNLIAKGRVANRAAEVVRTAIRPFLHSRVEVKTDGTGRISDLDKQFIESTVNKALEAALVNVTRGDGRTGHVSAINFTVNGENNLLGTGTLQGTITIVPLGYISQIEIQIFFNDVIVG
jgi:hypothetical protein